MKRGTDSHASDIGHWLGMTENNVQAIDPWLSLWESCHRR